MDWVTNQLGITPAIQGKIITTLIVVIVLLVLRWLAIRAIQDRSDETWVTYRASKTATYTVTIVGLLALAWVWIDAFDDLPTFLGLISAGIAIALADVLKNMAGWAYIMTRRPFRVGDRVEVDGTKGDVVDVRLFRFSLMEVGNWVDADQSTGRLIHIPNGILFTNQVANYTEGFEYIWHEIPVLITFESDRNAARRIIEDALIEHAVDIEGRAGRRIRETAKSYHIKVGTLTPTVYLTVRDSGVLLTARVLVDTRTKRDVEQRIWTHILDAFDAHPGIDLAYPTVRTYFQGPVVVEHSPTVPGRGHLGGADPAPGGND